MKEEIEMFWHKKKQKKNLVSDLCTSEKDNDTKIRHVYDTDNNSSGNELLIRHYTVSGSVKNQNYETPQILIDFSLGFDERVREFIGKTDLDLYNGDFYDFIIREIEKKAMDNIHLQRANHISSMNNLKNTCWRSEVIEVNRRLSQIISEMEACKKELKQLLAIKNKGTSFEEVEKHEE